MNALILACQLTPLLGLGLIGLFGRSERWTARISLASTRLMGVAMLGLLIRWSWLGFPRYEFEWFTLYRESGYQFPILFYFDRIGAAYLFCTWLIFSVIVRYCRHYLHREPGYQRFFLTIFAFVFGLNLVILSGTLDIFFAGWEIVGIASFLLIAFYHHRYQPIRNALRAYSIYRLCDLGLLLGALLIDLLLHGHNHFSQLAGLLQGGAAAGAHVELFGLSLLLILAAAGKSAQFPFCFWIPRAMEGPTPSSAIFYGALSVHLGVFLLLRTEPIWGHEWASRALVLAIGGLTVGVANLSEQAQSNIKGQIAYASITQVGLMFVELALGLESLVLLHFLGNAFLRCYQLLVSPSVVAHRLRREGGFDQTPDIRNSRMARSLPLTLREALPEALQNTLQVMALQEFNLDHRVRGLLWDPFRNLGACLLWPGWRRLVAPAVGVVLLGGWIHAEGFSMRPYLSLLVALVMLWLSLRAFAHKRAPLKTWNQLGWSTLLAGLAATLSSESTVSYLLIFLGSIALAWLIGAVIIQHVERDPLLAENPFLFRALQERHPWLSRLLFLAFLGMVGFPVTPAFLGQDLLLFHVSGEQAWLAPLIAFALVLNGISASGVYMRLSAGRPMELKRCEPG